MIRWTVLALCGAVAIGCGASNNGGAVVVADSGTTGGADTGASVDTGARADTGAASDRGSATTDRGSATTDRGTTTGGNFGMCNAAAPAVCRCTMTNQTCINAALSADMTCAQCLVQNQADCCPTEAMALQTCLQGANGTCMGDGACLQRACMTQVTAMQTCQTNRLQNEAMAGSGACLAGYIGCLGDLAMGLGACP